MQQCLRLDLIGFFFPSKYAVFEQFRWGKKTSIEFQNPNITSRTFLDVIFPHLILNMQFRAFPKSILTVLWVTLQVTRVT